MLTLCFTYFRSLGLDNLAAALYSVRRQDLSLVESVVVVDNNTTDSREDIQAIVDELAFPVPAMLYSYKHGDETRTHSWSTNAAVRYATTPWVLFSRADYLLDFDIVRRFVEKVERHHGDGEVFVTARGFHLADGIAQVEQSSWRHGSEALRRLPGVEVNYTTIDTGVWMTTRSAFESVGGMDESLTAWGHAQTHFQYRLHQAGVQFLEVPEILFFHPIHAAPRDIELAHRQLREQGYDVRELWARYKGPQPYGEIL